MAKIYVKFNSAVIKELEIDKPETTFGRKSTNDIVLDHATVSGFHGKIRKDGDTYTIEDLNSTNGTYVNGHKIKSQTLNNRDQIGVASHVLEFVLDGQAPSQDPRAPQQNSETQLGTDEQKEMLRKSLGIGQPAASGEPGIVSNSEAEEDEAMAAATTGPGGTLGVVKIISGAVNGQSEVRLKDLVTYIGTSDQAAIKIKGFLAPSLAAALSKRPEGYFLKAVKSGYPKVNGNPVNEQVFLENGALIEVGGTNMVFYDPEARKKLNKEEQA